MTKQEIDNLIIANIYTNDAGLITGIILQQVLLSITDFSAEQIADIMLQLHSHNNKAILDQFVQGHINVLSKLSLDADGKLKIDADAYSTGELSAYGVGSGTGGEVGYTRLDSWLQYVAGTSEGWVLSALLGKDLYDKLMTLTDRVSDVEGADSDKHYAFNQGTPSDVWVVNHNLSKYPAVMVVDSGHTEIIGDISYIDLNTVRVSFSSAFSGKVFCN